MNIIIYCRNFHRWRPTIRDAKKINCNCVRCNSAGSILSESQ